MARQGKVRQDKERKGKVREHKARLGKKVKQIQAKASKESKVKARLGNKSKQRQCKSRIGNKSKQRKGKARLGIDHILYCGFPIHLAYFTFIHGVIYLGIQTCGVVACMHILGGKIPYGHLAFELD
jgi:hypothetical protein